MLVPANQANVSAGETPAGAHHISAKNTAIITAPKAIHGRRRPQRVLVLSDKLPISGSVTASITREALRAMPINMGLTFIPTSKIGYASDTRALFDRFSLNPPRPQATFECRGAS